MKNCNQFYRGLSKGDREKEAFYDQIYCVIVSMIGAELILLLAGATADTPITVQIHMRGLL